MRAGRLATTALAAVLATAALAAPADAEPTEAERLYVEGQSAYDEGRYEIALALWQRSYELSQLPALLFNLGQAYRLRGATGDCANAVAAYRRYLELAPDAPQRPVAEGFLRDLQSCAPPGERPALGQPGGPAGAPPGGAQPEGPPGSQGELSRKSVAPRIVVETPGAEGEDRGAAKRVLGLAVVGGGVAIGIAGVYFGVRARTLADEVTEACATGCTWSEVADKDADGRAVARSQLILYGIGASAVITGGILYYLGRRERAAAVSIAPRTGGGLVTWSGRW